MSPKVREILYYVGTIIPGVIGLALVFGGIDQGTAENLGDVIVGILTMLGAAAPATAAVKVNQQRKDGTLNPVEPVEQVVNGVQAVLEAQAKALADAERVKQAVSATVGVVPGLGPLAAQIINSVPTPRF